MAAGEIYVPVPVNFADEPEVAALRKYGRDARSLRDLYVQLLCYCKRTLSDGFVPAEQIGLLVYPDPPKVGERDMKRLIDARLVETAVNGFFVPAYLERNPTKDEVQEASAGKSRGVRQANHQRWHVSRGESDPDCELCQEATQYGGQYGDQISDGRTDADQNSAGVNANGIPDSTRQDKTRQGSTPVVPAKAEQDDPDWLKFWGIYPRRRDKKPATTAWKRALKRATVDEIIAGAERYRAECTRERRAVKHIKLPATWLNNDCWDNADENGDTQPGQLSYSNSPWEN